MKLRGISVLTVVVKESQNPSRRALVYHQHLAMHHGLPCCRKQILRLSVDLIDGYTKSTRVAMTCVIKVMVIQLGTDEA